MCKAEGLRPHQTLPLKYTEQRENAFAFGNLVKFLFHTLRFFDQISNFNQMRLGTHGQRIFWEVGRGDRPRFSCSPMLIAFRG